MKMFFTSLVIAVSLGLAGFGGATGCGVQASSAPEPATAAAAAEVGNRARTTLHIEGMTCSGCETSVKIVVKKLPGVSDAEVSYEKKTAVITHDPDKVSSEQIAEAIRTTLGYEVTVVATTRS